MQKDLICIVDDEKRIIDFVRIYLEKEGFTVSSFTDGLEALEGIRASGPELVVLDVMLPDIDGWRLLMRLHEDPAARSIPVIICSVVQEEDLALSLGAARYLPKPVRPREFIQALDQVLPQALAVASRAPASSAEAC